MTIRAVPFAPGSDELDAAAREALQALASDVADDCFLSAQAVGHAEAAADQDADPTQPFRLAQNRADTVRQAMIGEGLSESAVVGVGDWQFLLREPRVTLWIYRLRPGAGCEGRPLDGPAVAALIEPADGSAGVPLPEKKAEVPSWALAAEQEPAVVAAVQPPESPARLAYTPPSTPVAPKPVVAVMQPLDDPEPAAGPDPVAQPRTPSAPIITVTELEPPKAPPPVVASAARTSANVRLANAPLPPLKDGTGLEIPFEANSSYLPEGTTAKLAKLLERVPRQQAMRVELAASFDPAMGTEDARYDRWLAERRMTRLAEWFDRNAQVKSLAVDRSVFEAKGPRRVIVRLYPGGPAPS